LSGGFAPSPLTDIRDLFEEVGLAGFGSLVELGSGDGRVVLLASLFTQAFGLEKDRAKAAASRARALSLGLDRAGFLAVDYLTADLSSYELLFIHPDREIGSLVAHLKGTYQGRLLVYGPLSTGTGLKALAEFNLKLSQARLFEI
jgi:hypothetical protein